jgi:hypothetical protein
MITPKKIAHLNSDEPSSNLDFSKFSFSKFIQVEMFGIGDPGHLEPQAEEHINNFLNVPVSIDIILLVFFDFLFQG